MSVAFHPPPRRISVRGVNWLGDAVMTTPALMRLREHFPDATLAMLCPEKLRDLWSHHPAVAEIHSFAPGESVFAVGKKLRAARFDLALVLPNSPRSALEVLRADNPSKALVTSRRRSAALSSVMSRAAAKTPWTWPVSLRNTAALYNTSVVRPETCRMVSA